MINYKKSLLSLATVMALSTSATAGYIPLTDSAGHENEWVLFGVTGLLSSGAGGGTTEGTFSITDDPKYTIIDSVKDEKFTNGLLVDSVYLAKAKTYTVSYVQIRINTDNFEAKPTEPIHTMYVTMEEGGGPAFAVTYDAALEGRTMEYSISSDGSNANTITLDSSKTYSNPGLGTLIQTIAGDSGATLSKLTDIVDYNLTDNPMSAAAYNITTNQTKATDGQYLRVYSYDTANTKWDLFDTRNSDDVNDFDTVKKGKAYWGKMVATSGTQAGLVLGSSSISAVEYQDAGLTEGWNLVSFSAEDSTIRNSSTGLLVELADADGGKLKIWDSAGNQSILVDNVEGATSAEMKTACLSINDAIKKAKINGEISNTFDLKAFKVDDTHIALISNKRFLITQGDSTDGIKSVKTLTGAIPYTVDPADIGNTDDATAIDDLTDTESQSAMSKYGEYSMIIEPLVGSDTESATMAKIHLQNAASDATDAAPIQIQTDVATVATDLTTSAGGADFVATQIDTTYDESVDKVLVASTKPFYVRDHTFTRVFDFNNVDSNSTIIVEGATASTVSIDLNETNSTAADVVASINADGNVSAAEITGKSQFVIFTSNDNASKFNVVEKISDVDGNGLHVDQLTDSTTDSDLAKGAVKGVYSLDTYSSATVNTSLAFNVTNTNVPDDNNNGSNVDTLVIQIRNNYGVDYNGTAYTVGNLPTTDSTAATAWAENLQTLLESAISNAKATATVSCTVGASDSVDVNITSSDVFDIAWTWTTGGEGNVSIGDTTKVDGLLSDVSPDLTSNLQFNAVYTPNYVSDGPLYSMKKAGFDMKSMVTGSTDLSTGDINWESIDLTRKPSEWLDSQDYSLFQTDPEAGYWVYLEASAGASALSIVNTTFTPVYKTHFNVNGTTYNNVAGQVSIEVAGLPQVGDANYDDSAVVKALVNGNTVSLTKRATNNVYSGDISSYELGISAGSDYGINANIADGLGSNLMNTPTGKVVDFTKPATPVINLGDGSAVSFTSTSADVAGYYVFNGQVPDYQTSSATNKLAELTSAQAGAYALCSATGMDKLATFDAEPYKLNVIAVDGTGKIGGGNSSDIVTQDYIPMLKNAVKLADTNNGESDATILGTEYANDCSEIGAQTEDYGMSITSESDLNEVKIAYEKEDSASDNAVQITAFFKGDTVIAKVTYSSVYVGSIVYLEVEGTVYSHTLMSEDDLDAHDSGSTDTDPILLNTDSTVTKRPAQQL